MTTYKISLLLAFMNSCGVNYRRGYLLLCLWWCIFWVIFKRCQVCACFTVADQNKTDCYTVCDGNTKFDYANRGGHESFWSHLVDVHTHLASKSLSLVMVSETWPCQDSTLGNECCVLWSTWTQTLHQYEYIVSFTHACSASMSYRQKPVLKGQMTIQDISWGASSDRNIVLHFLK